MKLYLSENYLALFSCVQNLAGDLVLINNFTCEYVVNLSVTLSFFFFLKHGLLLLLRELSEPSQQVMSLERGSKQCHVTS